MIPPRMGEIHAAARGKPEGQHRDPEPRRYGHGPPGKTNGEKRHGRPRRDRAFRGGPGRRKGAPNKVNAVLRDDILQAYQGRGGVEWLTALPDRLFVHLLAKIMPREVAADVNMGIGEFFGLDFAAMSDDELRRLAHAVDADLWPAGVGPAGPVPD